MDFHRHHRRDDDEDEQQRYPPQQPNLPYRNEPTFPPQHGYAPPQQPQPFFEQPQYPPTIQSHHHQGPSYNQFEDGNQEDFGYQRPSPPNPHPDRYGSGYSQPEEPPRHQSGGGYGYPSVQHVGHESGFSSHPQPQPQHGFPSVQHVGHESGYSHPQPQAQPQHGFSSVQHVGHESYNNNQGGGGFDEARHRPHLPNFDRNHSGGSGFPRDTPTVRVYSKAEPNYSLTIRDGQVVLARSDERDPCQHWIKDEKYSVRVKDEEGFPSFSLVNKATGLAVKHSNGATNPVQLVPYNPDVLDQSVLWTESRDLGDSYRCIRMVNNIRLNMDAFHGDKNHGGVRDGTTIVLWEWLKGDNQRWKIAPY